MENLGYLQFYLLGPLGTQPLFFQFYFRFIGKILQNIFAVGIGDLHLCIHWFFLISLHGWVPSILCLKIILILGLLPPWGVPQGDQTGVNLVGEEPFSPLYMEKLQPASMTIQQLEASAPYNRKLTMLRPMAEHEKPYANRLVELSQEEVDEKFLSGPFFTEEEVSTHLGTTSWTLTKRFLLIQGEDGKERVIDDYKRSLVNGCSRQSR